MFAQEYAFAEVLPRSNVKQFMHLGFSTLIT